MEASQAGWSDKLSSMLERKKDYEKFPLVDVTQDQAKTVSDRLNYWSAIMLLETKPKLEFRDMGMQEGYTRGMYNAERDVLIMNSNIFQTDPDNIDAVVAHESGHAADRRRTLHEAGNIKKILNGAMIAGGVLGAGLVTGGVAFGPALGAGLVAVGALGICPSASMASRTSMAAEKSANEYALLAGLPAEKLLKLYDRTEGKPLHKDCQVLVDEIKNHGAPAKADVNSDHAARPAVKSRSTAARSGISI